MAPASEGFVALCLLVELCECRGHVRAKFHSKLPNRAENVSRDWQIHKDESKNNIHNPVLVSHSCGSVSDYRVENGIFFSVLTPWGLCE